MPLGPVPFGCPFVVNTMRLPLKAHEKHAIGFLMRHLVYGTVGSITLGGAILYSDIGGIRTLAMSGQDGGLAIALLFFGLFITGGSVGMGIGVMSLSDGREDQID